MLYQKFINALLDEGLSKRTVEIIHGTLYSAMKKAIQLNKIESNPCDNVEIYSTDEKKKKKIQSDKFIESKDIPKFLQSAYEYNYIYYILFKTLIHTGMRKGEALALQWDHVDFKNRIIFVDKSLYYDAKNEDELFGDTKTPQSVRTFKMDSILYEDMKFHLKWQNQNKLALGSHYKHHLNLVFCRNNGSEFPTSTLFNAFERICKRANLPKLPIHSLRHTHAVLMLESGIEMKYVQERLGHKSIQVTSDIYSHVSKKIEDTSVDKFEEYMETIEKRK